VEEPCRFGVAIAVVASFRDRVVDPSTVLIGGVGLGGQVRPVSQMELRLKKLPTRLQTQLYQGSNFPDVDLISQLQR